MPVIVVGDASLIVVDANVAGVSHSLGLSLGLSLVPAAGAEAAIVGVEASLPVVGVVGNAILIGGNADTAGVGHDLGFSLGLSLVPAAAAEAPVVVGQAGLPVIRVVGNAILVVRDANTASVSHSLGSNGSLGLSLVPMAATETHVVGAEAGLPVVGAVGDTGLVGGDTRAAGGHVDGSVAP
jgi:hypothetical protein